ncbi:DUF2637 domain-containing protein [Streptomyces sp. NPDC007172]|uniref:DUF2637 domain-containing protein n=1 Tax=Streptomyces sp. NPDC007172 TaxID=3364776 RepID=UPI0036B354C3
MTTVPWALPAGLTVAGVGAAAAVAMVLGSRRRTAEQNATAEERAQLALQRRNAWQHRLAVIALGIGCLMMFVLAGIAAWLSFGAQREYAHAHNGGDWDAATGFALLLDAGALSLSLIRFFEALTLRSSAITRILLLAFVSASAAMNLLHAPVPGAGSAFLAMVPPLVYAILLEMLLFKVEQVIMGRQKRRPAGTDRGYSLLLWLPWPIGAPVKLWKAWRTELLATVGNVRVVGSQHPHAQQPDAPSADEVTLERAGGSAPLSAAPTAMMQVSAPTAGILPPASDQVAEPEAKAVASVPAPAEKGPELAASARGLSERPAEPEEALTPAPEVKPRPNPAPELQADVGQQAAPVLDAKVRDDSRSGPDPMAESQKASASSVESVEKKRPADQTDEDEPSPGTEAADADQDEGETVPDPEHHTPPHAEGDDEDEPSPGIEGADGDETEPDPEHHTPPHTEGDDEARERVSIEIDLSVLPTHLSQRQRAERIYIAHQAAGVALSQADLGRWAGYKNPNSGGNEYRRLERMHGPILVREGATHVDLNWSDHENRSGSGHAAAA